MLRRTARAHGFRRPNVNLHEIAGDVRLIGGLPRYLRHPITAVEGLTSVRHGFEQVLPGQFGGGPSDYQLIESEAADGRAVVALRLHPAWVRSTNRRWWLPSSRRSRSEATRSAPWPAHGATVAWYGLSAASPWRSGDERSLIASRRDHRPEGPLRL